MRIHAEQRSNFNISRKEKARHIALLKNKSGTFLLRDRFYRFGVFLPVGIAGYRDWIAAAKRAEHGVVPDIFAAIFTVTFHKASSPLKLASVDIVVTSHDFVQ